MEAMCIELGQLAQGYKDVKGMETTRFMTLDEITNIPQDWAITYTRIVGNYCTQEKDPNRVRIMVGGSLIDYPYKLTT